MLNDGKPEVVNSEDCSPDLDVVSSLVEGTHDLLMAGIDVVSCMLGLGSSGSDEYDSFSSVSFSAEPSTDVGLQV